MPLFNKKDRPLQLRFLGDPVLRQESIDIPEINDEVRELAQRMILTMRENNGQGLAAPQVGKSVNLITLEVMPPGPDEPPASSPGEVALLNRMPLVMVNPKISDESPERHWDIEGCLSLPGMSAPVERSSFIQITFQTLEGKTESYRVGGMLGRCLQHEIDHLNGTLYIDHVNEDDLKLIQNKIDRLRRRTERGLKRKR